MRVNKARSKASVNELPVCVMEGELLTTSITVYFEDFTLIEKRIVLQRVVSIKIFHDNKFSKSYFLSP